MPHSTPADEDDDDLKLIQQALNPDPRSEFNDFLNPERELVLGEKADDAVDYEDVDLDELPDEELATGVELDEGDVLADNGVEQEDGFIDLNDLAQGDRPPIQDDAVDPGFDLDDLFGDVPSSPTAAVDDVPARSPGDVRTAREGPVAGRQVDQEPTAATRSRPTSSANQKDVSETLPGSTEDDAIDNELYARQMALFGELRILPPAPETREEALAVMFPKYRKDQVPRFMELLPPRRLLYQGKTPLKVPKPVHPTKIALDLAPDQERGFGTVAATVSKKRKTMHSGVVQVAEDTSASESSDEEFEFAADTDEESIGGVTWRDLETVCQDWDIDLLEKSSDDGLVGLDEQTAGGDTLFDDDDAEWDREFAIPPPKVSVRPTVRTDLGFATY